jgi:fatty-acyl-CoA synthase
MGLIGFLIGTLFTDIPVVFMPTASFVRNPRLWLDKIHQHRGTITYAPNFAYQLVAKRLKDKDVAGLDLSCLHRAGCGRSSPSA